jgi:predicted O-methyltransferase YrrM
MTAKRMPKRTVSTKILRRLKRYTSGIAAMASAWYQRRALADAAVSDASKIHTHMTARELQTLYGLAGEAQRVLEIGSYVGASSCYLAAALAMHDGHLYCVDTWANETMPDGERNTFDEFTANTRGVASTITTIRKRSDEIAATDFPLPFDLVFIDADHSYAAVKGDFAKVRDWVRDGRTVAFHDTTYFEGVSRVLGEILATGQWQLAGNVDSLTWLHKIGRTGSFPNPMTDAERALLK